MCAYITSTFSHFCVCMQNREKHNFFISHAYINSFNTLNKKRIYLLTKKSSLNAHGLR